MIFPLLKAMSAATRMLIMCSTLDHRLGPGSSGRECPTIPFTLRYRHIITIYLHPSDRHSLHYVSCMYNILYHKSCLVFYLQYSSGKRTKKLFILNIDVSRTSQKHSESNRVNVIFGGHHSQVRRKYVLWEVTRNGNIVPRRQYFSRSDAKLGII